MDPQKDTIGFHSLWISGLTLAGDRDDLLVLYLAAIQSLAYATRSIAEQLAEHGGYRFKVLLLCGGLAQNSVFTQTLADVLKIPVVLPEETESVLLGAALLGVTASASEGDVAREMGRTGTVILPNVALAGYHDMKYKVFQRLGEDQLVYRSLMSS
ncbi:unnamed protein product [Cyprideis torosa]|uniref:Carbohydrate kinase FGGY C-terminal domain-containing protein n=1 Tax=Cyprideis torosa TaxID=163714 RepID=A0A7R8ZQH8_9CRUS|nr:unnamed protein product [Cyprideis torosa]CAG0890712.1 unnamed protein product [Cyprideis torosa]